MDDTTQQPVAVPDVPKPIVIGANAAAIDALQAGFRFLVVLIGFGVALAGFVKARDFAGFVSYVQTNLGAIVSAVAGLIAAATTVYGIFKTYKRSAQIVSVAADTRTPDEVAQIKPKGE